MGKIVGTSSSTLEGGKTKKEVGGDAAQGERIPPTATGATGEEVALGPPMPDGLVTGVEHRFRQEEEDLHVVDASSSVEEVAEEVWKVVRARVEAVERGEIGKAVRRVS